MGEVLFVQVGNNANYIASHMWNSRHEGAVDEQAAKLYHSGTRKTYPRSIFVESPNNLGNLNSLESENEPKSSIWDGSMLKASSEPGHQAQSIPDPARHGSKYWTDFLQPELHHKSICELPKWTNGEYFDAFHKGVLQSSSNDTITTDFMDGLIDQCRYFAEACDHLSTIEITTEHTGGVAGLTTSLLQALREEFGNAVCMPVWCANARKIDERVLKYEGATLLDNIATMHNRISVLDSALFFSRSLEYASSIVPISMTRILQGIYGVGAVPSAEADHQYNTYISTATAAAALNAACVYQSAPTVTPRAGSMSASHYKEGGATEHGAGRSFDPREQSSHNTLSLDINEAPATNAHQWCALATMRGRLPMCFLEASFPGILTNPEVKFVGEYPGLEQHLLDSFDPQKRSLSAGRDGAVVGLGTVNPFATSLSPLPWRQAGAQLVPDFPFARAFTNLLSIRGSSSSELREGLYAQSTSLPYRVTACQLNATPLIVSSTSPFYNEDAAEEEEVGQEYDGGDGDGDAEGGQRDYEGASHHQGGQNGPSKIGSQRSCVELATSVNTSPTVGAYLQSQADLWHAASAVHALQVQLEKAGMDATERTEVTEQLREVAARYQL